MYVLSNADQHVLNVLQHISSHLYFISFLDCGELGYNAFVASLVLDAAACRRAL